MEIDEDLSREKKIFEFAFLRRILKIIANKKPELAYRPQHAFYHLARVSLSQRCEWKRTFGKKLGSIVGGEYAQARTVRLQAAPSLDVHVAARLQRPMGNLLAV